jgi:hypothetical protein
VTLQFCLAHFIRDVKFLTTLPDARDRAYGERLRQALRELFGVIHRREALSAEAFGQQLQAARAEVLRQGGRDVPPGRHSQALAKRLAKHGDGYLSTRSGTWCWSSPRMSRSPEGTACGSARPT